MARVHRALARVETANFLLERSLALRLDQWSPLEVTRRSAQVQSLMARCWPSGPLQGA